MASSCGNSYLSVKQTCLFLSEYQFKISYTPNYLSKKSLTVSFSSSLNSSRSSLIFSLFIQSNFSLKIIKEFYNTTYTFNPDFPKPYQSYSSKHSRYIPLAAFSVLPDCQSLQTTRRFH